MMTSPYLSVTARKRKWTPVAVDRGTLVDGSEDSLFRAVALSKTLELPVKELLQQGLERDLPDTPGVVEALKSNQNDEENHDQAFGYIVDAWKDSIPEKYFKEAKHILKSWLEAPEHPILKAAIAERSVFFVLLPFYRFNGDIGMRTTAADVSRDEIAHVAIHHMVSKELGEVATNNLNRLRRATVAWFVDGLSSGNENKYLDKDFWLKQSDSLYYRGKADGLEDTRRARVPAFFEASNVNLPMYG